MNKLSFPLEFYVKSLKLFQKNFNFFCFSFQRANVLTRIFKSKQRIVKSQEIKQFSFMSAFSENFKAFRKGFLKVLRLSLEFSKMFPRAIF